STGFPKGVCMGQRALTNLLVWQSDNSIADSKFRTLQFASLSFDVSFQEIFSTLITGGSLILISHECRLDPAKLLKTIKEKAINRIFVPFVALQTLTESASSQKHYPSCLKEIITAGEQLKITPQIREFFKKLPQCRLYNQYGP